MTTVSVNRVTSTTPVAHTETQQHNFLLGLQRLRDALPQQSQKLQTQKSNLEVCISLPQLLVSSLQQSGEPKDECDVPPVTPSCATGDGCRCASGC